MSELLSIVPGEVVGINTTVLDVHNRIKTRLVDQGWQLVAEDTVSDPKKLYIIPPSTELIGDTRFREVVFIETTKDYIDVRPITESLVGCPQVCYFAPKVAGKITSGITINNVAIAADPATQNTNNTAEDNLRYLFDALITSSDPVIAGWDWVYRYPPKQNANDGSQHIFGIKKTNEANVTINNGGNFNGGTLSDYVPAGFQNGVLTRLCPPFRVNIDLANGFILFMQINKRGFALATRTNLGYYGATHACYGDHTKAIAAVPNVGKWQRFISPTELVVGQDYDAGNVAGLARTAKNPT